MQFKCGRKRCLKTNIIADTLYRGKPIENREFHILEVFRKRVSNIGGIEKELLELLRNKVQYFENAEKESSKS